MSFLIYPTIKQAPLAGLMGMGGGPAGLAVAGVGLPDDIQFSFNNSGGAATADPPSDYHLQSKTYSAGITTSYNTTLTANAEGWLSAVAHSNGWYKLTTRSDRSGKIKVRMRGGCSGSTNRAGGGSSNKGYRGYGRDIEATFTFSGERILWFMAGASGDDVGWQWNNSSTGASSGAGGASVFAYQSGSDYYPILIAAGGSGATNKTDAIDYYKGESSSSRVAVSAGPLTGPTTGAVVQAIVNSRYSNQGNSNYDINTRKGVGQNNNGGGGAGWGNKGYATVTQSTTAGSTGSSDHYLMPNAADDADNNKGQGDGSTSDNSSGDAIEGGWGGGGSGYLGSVHSPGGGGFFGGYSIASDEIEYAEDDSTYAAKVGTWPNGADKSHFAPLSFCSPVGGADTRGDDAGTKQTAIAYVDNSLTDHGLWSTDNNGSSAINLKNNNNTADKIAYAGFIIDFLDAGVA